MRSPSPSSIDQLPLPYLSFALPTLRLTYSNPSCGNLFSNLLTPDQQANSSSNTSASPSGPWRHAQEFFVLNPVENPATSPPPVDADGDTWIGSSGGGGGDAEDVETAIDARPWLAKLNQMTELGWGEEEELEYWHYGSRTRRKPKRARVAVTIQEDTVSIVFIAPTSSSGALRPFRSRTASLPASPAASIHSGSTASFSSNATVIDLAVPSNINLTKILEDYEGGGGNSRKLSKREMEIFMDYIPQICFTCGPDGKVDFLSRKWFEYTGIVRDENFELSMWTSYFHPDDMPTALAAFGEALATGNDMEMEYRVLSATGEWRWFVARGIPVYGEDDTIHNWVATLTEVEELVQVRRDALRIREHVLAVLSGSDVILMSVSSKGEITYVEGSLKLSLALPLPEGQRLADVWPDAKLLSGVEKVLSGDELQLATVVDSNIDAPNGDGKIYFRYRIVPLIEGGAVTGAIIVLVDITERVKKDEALAQSAIEKSRLQASELAAVEASRLKTEFVTNISHETRTPIAGMIGICEILLDEPELAAEHRILVEKCLRSGEILLDLVGMVLDLGKVEAGKLGMERIPFRLSEIVADATIFSIVAEKKGLEFRSDIGELFEGVLIGDKMRMRQVLANGLSNAAKFTSSGSITLKVRQESETAFQVLVTFEIEDTGVGIDEAILPTLFVPFRQAESSTARRFGGTGLGLAITRQFLSLMDGNVRLESVKGSGTKMIIHVPFDKAPIEIPRRRSNLETEQVTYRPLPRSPGASEARLFAPMRSRRPEEVRILLAEDNDLIREIVTRTLLKMKFNVAAVEDGAKAVQAVQESHFDLILMDGQMPGLDGYQATSKIRQLSAPIRDIKIIALTASAIQGDRERCLEAGMSGYLAKPVRAKDLEAAIWEQLES